MKYDKIIGTTQVEPLEYVINPGGFTDGDRILYFLRSLLLPKQKLFLIGMDFKNVIGKYSKLNFTANVKGEPAKVKKLQYTISLIEWLMEIVKNNFYFINSERISEKFTYLSIEEFERIVCNSNK